MAGKADEIIWDAPAKAKGIIWDAPAKIPGKRRETLGESAAAVLTEKVAPFAGFVQGVGEVTSDPLAKGIDWFGHKIGLDFGLTPAVEQNKRQYEQVFGGSTGGDVGRFAGNVFGTAPIGGAVAAPLKAVARAAPRVAPALAPAITALETSGMRTGLAPASFAPRVGNKAIQAGAGALTGAATAAVMDQPLTEGAAVGALVPTAVAPTAKFVAQKLGNVWTYLSGKAGEIKARQLITDTIGPEINDIITKLPSIPEGVSAAQGLVDAGVQPEKVRQFMALFDQVQKRDLEGFYTDLRAAQDAARQRALSQTAGGATRTEARAAREAAQYQVNAMTGPQRQAALGAANQTNQVVPQLQREAALAGEQAAAQVERARRFGPASERLFGTATAEFETPFTMQQANVAKGLAGRADLETAKAAEASLAAGAARRTAEQRLADLEAQGIKPIKPETFTAAIERKLRDPEVGVSDENRKVLTAVGRKVQEWTQANGTVDAQALSEIRKTTVNDVVRRLMPTADAAAVKKRAAQIAVQIKPLIDDAIEQAGGKGWRQYLRAHESGMTEISRMKLADKAKAMYEKSPEAYVELLKGNNPKEIEKIFGAGSYDVIQKLGSEYGPSRVPAMLRVSKEITRDIDIAKTGAAAKDALERTLRKNRSFRVNLLNRAATLFNESRDLMEAEVKDQTMIALDKAMRSGKDLRKVIESLPSAEQMKVLSVLYNTAGRATTVNALAPERKNQNAMTVDPEAYGVPPAQLYTQPY